MNKRKFNIKAKLINMKNYELMDRNVLLVGRIHKGNMEIKLAFGQSFIDKNSVKHNETFLNGRKSHRKSHF